MRIPSGTTDQYIYFVAVDETDLNTRETGLSSFTVYRSRNGAAAAAMSTPTINETDSVNMPGVYELLLDEDMTIGAGNETEEMLFHITHSGMAPVSRTIELYRPVADSVWDAPLSGHQTAGTAGRNLTFAGTILSETTLTGTPTTSVFRLSAGSATDDFYNDMELIFISGNAAGLSRIVSDYNGTTKDVTVDEPLPVTPSASDAVVIRTIHKHSKSQIAAAVWDELKSAHVTAGTFGEIATEIAQVSTESQEIQALIESQRRRHTVQGNIFFVDPINGDTHANGNRGGPTDPYNSIQDCHDNAVVDSNHDLIFLVSGATGGTTLLTEDVSLSKRYLQVRGPGREFIVRAATNTNTITVSADGVGLEGFRVETTGAGSGDGITASSVEFIGIRGIWFENNQGDSINLTNCTNFQIEDCNLQGSGQSGAGDAIRINSTVANGSDYGRIFDNYIENASGDGIILDNTGSGTINDCSIERNKIFNSTGYAVRLQDASVIDTVLSDNRFAGNASGDILDNGTDTTEINNTPPPTTTEIADAILNRDFASVSDTNARTLLNAARFLRNKYSVSGSTLTVTKEDDTTSAWTATLTTDAGADPVTGSDPA